MGPQQDSSPDVAPIERGQYVLAAARNQLLDHLDQALQPGLTTLKRTQEGMESYLNSALQYGQSVLDEHRANLDRNISLRLADALTTSQDYGIELPSTLPPQPSTGVPASAPPEAARGLSPQPAIDPNTGYVQGLGNIGVQTDGGSGLTGWEPICQVHLLDDPPRSLYVWLIGMTRFAADLQAAAPAHYACYLGPGWDNGAGIVWTGIHKFDFWWQAELACRLLEECRFTRQQVFPRFNDIGRVQIFDPTSNADMSALCSLKWQQINDMLLRP